MANIQNLTSIVWGGAQPLSERPELTFALTQLFVRLADGTAGGSFGLAQVGGIAVTGTNTAGNDIIVSGGPSTGTGAPGDILLQTAPAGSTGSTLNTLVNRILLQGTRIALVTTVAKTLFTVTLPTLTGAGGIINYSIFSTDGTDMQIRVGTATWGCVNKGGSFTSDTDIQSGSSVAASTGTLTATFAGASGTNLVNYQLTATTSLTPTTFFCDYVVENHSGQAVSLATS